MREPAQRHRLLGDDVEARADRRGARERALEGLCDVVGVDVVQDAEAEVGQRKRLARDSRRQTPVSRLPAGVITCQPGPEMWPGCRTTLGTPPAIVSRCSSASTAALPVPYSP